MPYTPTINPYQALANLARRRDLPDLADALTALGELPPDARSRVVALILDMRAIARQRVGLEPVEPSKYDMDIARDVALSKIPK